MKKTMAAVVCLLVLGVVGVCVFTEAGVNGWCLLTARGWVLPREASVFTFRVTKWNEGSGEWWLYGEDARNFYQFVGDGAVSYVRFPKDKVGRCEGFVATDGETWCAEYAVRVGATER